MHYSQYTLALLTVGITALAAPTNISLAEDSANGPSACGQTATITDGAYDVQADQYNGGVGSVCAYSHGHNKQGIQWSSTWNFQAPSSDNNPVKAYPNAFIPDHKKAGTCKKVKDTSIINSSWKWSYHHTGKGFTADVSYDIFLKGGSNVDCSTAAGSHDFEVMVWLAAYGQYGGHTFRPVGNKLKKGFTYKNKHGREFHFDLYEGPHDPGNPSDNWKVYSFLPAKGKTYNEFDGNLAAFLHEIANHHDKHIAEATVQSVQAGTEVVAAEHATFQTHRYSVGK